MKGTFGRGQVYVAKPDGTGLTLVTPEPLSAIASYAFSPNGRELLVSTELGIASTMLVATIDGKTTRTLAVGSLAPSAPTYRPPDGGEIVFVGQRQGETASGLFAIKPDGTGLRPVVEPSNLIVGGPKWSPDGTKIVFNAVRVEDEIKRGGWLRVYVVGADGQTPRILRDLAGRDDLESVVAWSNDGTRLLISGCYRSEGGVADCPSTDERQLSQPRAGARRLSRSFERTVVLSRSGWPSASSVACSQSSAIRALYQTPQPDRERDR